MKNLFHITGIEKLDRENDIQVRVSGWYDDLHPSDADVVVFVLNGHPVKAEAVQKKGIEVRLKYLRVRANIDAEYSYCISIEKSSSKHRLKICQRVKGRHVTLIALDLGKSGWGDVTNDYIHKYSKLYQMLLQNGFEGTLQKAVSRILKISESPYRGYKKIQVTQEIPLFGEFVPVYEGGCKLKEDAAARMKAYITQQKEADFFYMDEECDGIPYFKPDCDEDLIRSHNYVGALFYVKNEIYESAKAMGKWSSHYELVLRCWFLAKNKYHIPEVLFRAEKKNLSQKEQSEEIQALKKYFALKKIDASAIEVDNYGYYHTLYALKEKPKVSVIIPNKDHFKDLKICVESILTKTTYSDYEILVVENNSTKKETFDGYEQLKQRDSRIRIFNWDKPFNYSAINNFAVSQSNGEYLIFLNNDTELLTGNWIEELLGRCTQADVGAVGVKLYYPDRTIQHAGVIVGLGGVAGHAFGTCCEDLPTYLQYGRCMRGQSAVTAACMMVKRSVFDAVGGFCEGLQIAFNDIDLCLNIREKKQQIVYNPYVELVHYESKSRGMEDTPEKVERFHQEIIQLVNRHPWILETYDPYYNPNLTIDKSDYSYKQRKADS